MQKHCNSAQSHMSNATCADSAQSARAKCKSKVHMVTSELRGNNFHDLSSHGRQRFEKGRAKDFEVIEVGNSLQRGISSAGSQMKSSTATCMSPRGNPALCELDFGMSVNLTSRQVAGAS